MNDIFKEINELINKSKESTTYENVTFSKDTNINISIKEIIVRRGEDND